MSESPEICADEDPKRNSPRIGRYVAIGSKPTYFIFVERKIHVHVASMHGHGIVHLVFGTLHFQS